MIDYSRDGYSSDLSASEMKSGYCEQQEVISRQVR